MTKTEKLHVGIISMALLGLTLLAVKNYELNASSLLRIGQTFGKTYAMPSGIVLYDPRGYDGELYYQVTRNIPQFFFGDNYSNIPFYGNAYRWQRILLPLTVYALSFGHESLFPAMFVLINSIAIILSLTLTIKLVRKLNIHTLTAIFNPAAMVGLLFSLTEPLSLLFITAFLLRWERKSRQIDMPQVSFLTLAVFARETTLFLIILLAVSYLLFATAKNQKLKIRNFLVSLLPILSFALWQAVLYIRLGALPMAQSSGTFDWRFAGTIGLIQRTLTNLNIYVLSSMTFLALFALPLLIYGIYLWFGEKRRSLALFLLGGLTVIMFSMKVALWGVLTSIGRVITPIYPVYALAASENDSKAFRLMSLSLIVISIALALGIAMQKHVYIVS